MSDLDDIYYAISGLEQAAERLSSYAKNIHEWDRVKEFRKTASEARAAYQRMTAKLPEAFAALEAKNRSYDAYVTREPEGCSCHINPPCSFCTREADEESA